LDDIDSCSMGSMGSGSGAALDHAASPGYVRPSQVSAAIDLWMRVLAHRGPVAHAPCSPPVDQWNRILGRRLAAQFPEDGLDADQVFPLSVLASNSMLSFETFPDPPVLRL
jgi:hypothetical protein